MCVVSSTIRHTSWALGTGVQTCALPDVARQAAQGVGEHRSGPNCSWGGGAAQDRENRPVQGSGKRMKPLPIQNSWVLVTEASTGLGRASALRLAESYQAKPLIVGRRHVNLRELQSEIGERFNVQFETIVAHTRALKCREEGSA